MTPISYMARTCDYYRAQGFTSDYQWAQNDETPFTGPCKPLEESVVTLITTAVVESDIPKPIRSAASYSWDRVPEAFDTDDLSWDKDTTHTNDRASYFPMEALQTLAEQGTIGRLANRFHFVPTEYSQRHTNAHDAPHILSACIEDNVDIAILVPL